MNDPGSFHSTIGKIQFALLLLLSFLLPFKLFVPPVIILFGLSWLIEGRFREKFQMIGKDPLFYILTGYFLFHLIGMLWTTDYANGWFDLQVKLSLVVMPLLIGMNIALKKVGAKPVLLAYLAGLLFSALYCAGDAMLDYFMLGIENYFYTGLSAFMHPSYYAMYLAIGLVIVVWLCADKTITGGKRAGLLCMGGFFVLMVILLQSKSGIIFTAVCLFAAILWFGLQIKRWLPVLVSLAAISLAYFLVNRYVVTPANSRIYNATYNVSEEKIKPGTSESSQVRIVVWQTVAELIPSYWTFGTGTGDINMVLKEAYKRKGMDYAYAHSLNAHNQFFQSFLALGIIGFLLLFLSFILAAWRAMKRRELIYIIFLLCVFLNFLPESMLETQAGVVFYAFFNSLFLFHSVQSAKA